MKQTLFTLSLILVGCSSKNQEPDSAINEQEPNRIQIENSDLEITDTLLQTEKSVNQPCLESNKEYQFYKKHGEVRFEGTQTFCTYTKDSIYYSLHYMSCEVKSRFIKNTNNKACSFTKYYNDSLKIFDSIGSDGNKLITYIRDLNILVFKGETYKPGLEFLPEYIQKELQRKTYL